MARTKYRERVMYNKSVPPAGIATNRVGVVHVATADLESALHGLEEAASELIARLAHVVNDAELLTGGDCSPAYSVPLAQTVQSAERRVRLLSARLRDTLDRLEI